MLTELKLIHLRLTKTICVQVTSRDKEIHEREEELRKVQDLHSKDKKTMEEIEAQLKKTTEERALLAEQIFREKEMAAEADDVSSVTLSYSVLAWFSSKHSLHPHWVEAVCHGYL